MSDLDRRMLLGAAGLVGAAALAKLAKAGPLEPPPGPVTETGVTLGEIAQRTARPGGIAEARRPIPAANGITFITEPGSYYLTRDLVDVEIVIQASNVTLDLNGFTLIHTGFISAIRVDPGGLRNILIRNGTVRHTGSPGGGVPGIRVGWDTGTANDDIVVEDMVVSGFTSGQIGAQGIASPERILVRRCVLSQDIGVTLSRGGVVEDCVIGPGVGGISMTFGGTAIVRRCRMQNLSGGGVSSPGSVVVQDCQFVSCGPTIRADGQGSRIERTTIQNAAGFAISLGLRSAVADCVIQTVAAGGPTLPGIGIIAGQRLRVERTQINGCAAQGIRVTSFDATIHDCTITENGGIGIDCIGPAAIERCHMANNTGAISVDQLTRVSQCHLDFNGPFGVRATATGGSIGGVDVVDCTITRHTTGVSLAAAQGCAVRRCVFFGNGTAISSGGGGNFTLLASGVAAANAATNPNANIAI